MKTIRSNPIVKVAASVVLGLGVVAGANALDETFQASLQLVTPLSIQEDQAMNFGESYVGSASAIAANDANGYYASFTVNGDLTKTATASVAEASIEMTTGDGADSTKKITIDSFSVHVGTIAGSNQLDFSGDGQVADIRVYGTANQEANDIAGTYTGSATFQVIYN